MSIVRWNPFENLSFIQKDINKIFDDNFLAKEFSNVWAPGIDVRETGESYQVKADLPGLKADDINVEINKNSLVISGERKAEKEEKETNYYKREISYGSFKRQVTLPQPVDADKITAKYTDGVLQVTVPKSEKAKAKQISIN
jgi:HSP20 family protein